MTKAMKPRLIATFVLLLLYGQCVTATRSKEDDGEIYGYGKALAVKYVEDSYSSSSMIMDGLVGGALVGAYLLPHLASMTVPYVMSATGTVVAGVGTIHAAGGVGAILQAASMSTVSSVGAAIGGVVGAAAAEAIAV